MRIALVPFAVLTVHSVNSMFFYFFKSCFCPNRVKKKKLFLLQSFCLDISPFKSARFFPSFTRNLYKGEKSATIIFYLNTVVIYFYGSLKNPGDLGGTKVHSFVFLWPQGKVSQRMLSFVPEEQSPSPLFTVSHGPCQHKGK